MFPQCGVDAVEQDGMTPLCSADGLRNDLFHNAVPVEVLCGQLHKLTGFAAAGGIFPEDAGKAFRAEDGVDRIFQHEDVVGHSQSQCAAGRAFAGDDGEDGNGLAFAGNLAPAPLAVHENAYLSVPDPYVASLVEPVFPGCHAPVDAAAAIASGTFERAAAVASDLNAQLIATAATRPGTCLEIGAGRGTKTFVMMCQARRAGFDRLHYALDLHERKCDQNLQRLIAAGIHGVRMVAGDATDLDGALVSHDARAGERLMFDTVFVDAPCSGSGTMRHHPEIPWRLGEHDVMTELPSLQLSMLEEAAGRLAPTGELFYATCSVFGEENIQVVDRFLASPAGRDFSVEPVSGARIFSLDAFGGARDMVRLREDDRGMFQSVPVDSDAFDGHFCCRLVRHAS